MSPCSRIHPLRYVATYTNVASGQLRLNCLADLHDRNVMLGLVPGALDQGPTPSERYKQVGRPQKFPLPSCDFVWRAGDLVAPIEWPSSIVAKTAFLSDFGLTRRAGSPVTDDLERTAHQNSSTRALSPPISRTCGVLCASSLL